MYQPELGRFLQPDPKEFTAGEWSELGSRDMDCMGRMVMRPRERERTSHYNLYRYCHNDPVNSTDPTGLSTDWNWSQSKWLQGGSTKSSEVTRELDRLHSEGYVSVAQISFARTAGQSAPTVTDFRGFYNAAKSTFDEIYKKVTAEKTEFYSRIDKNDKAGTRIVGKVTRGDGVKDFNDFAGKGRGETSGITNEGLSKDFRVEGFVLGHRNYDPMYIQMDMKRSHAAGWHSIYLTPPQTGAGASLFTDRIGMQIIPYDYTKPEPTLYTH